MSSKANLVNGVGRPGETRALPPPPGGLDFKGGVVSWSSEGNPTLVGFDVGKHRYCLRNTSGQLEISQGTTQAGQQADWRVLSPEEEQSLRNALEARKGVEPRVVPARPSWTPATQALPKFRPARDVRGDLPRELDFQHSAQTPHDELVESEPGHRARAGTITESEPSRDGGRLYSVRLGRERYVVRERRGTLDVGFGNGRFRALTTNEKASLRTIADAGVYPELAKALAK